MDLRLTGAARARRLWRSCRGIVCAAAIALVCGAAVLYGATSASPPPDIAYREIRWYDLTPKEWDPTKRFRELKLDAMRDGDPRAERLLLDMRATWDNAPTVAAMDGAAVKLAGYVVPLEGNKAELREFLLVPYFGACVHSPPPPANQIVHVIADQPARGLRTMDTVWVSGTMKTIRQASIMGASGYQIDAVLIERYERHP